jgi:hypothetical protein
MLMKRHFPRLQITTFRSLSSSFYKDCRRKKHAEVYTRYTIVLEEKS